MWHIRSVLSLLNLLFSWLEKLQVKNNALPYSSLDTFTVKKAGLSPCKCISRTINCSVEPQLGSSTLQLYRAWMTGAWNTWVRETIGWGWERSWGLRSQRCQRCRDFMSTNSPRGTASSPLPSCAIRSRGESSVSAYQEASCFSNGVAGYSTTFWSSIWDIPSTWVLSYSVIHHLSLRFCNVCSWKFQLQTISWAAALSALQPAELVQENLSLNLMTDVVVHSLYKIN